MRDQFVGFDPSSVQFEKNRPVDNEDDENLEAGSSVTNKDYQDTLSVLERFGNQGMIDFLRQTPRQTLAAMGEDLNNEGGWIRMRAPAEDTDVAGIEALMPEYVKACQAGDSAKRRQIIKQILGCIED